MEIEKKPRRAATKQALCFVSSVAAKEIVPNTKVWVGWLLVGGVSRGGGRKGSQAMYTENLVLRIKLTLISPRGYCSNTQ